MTIATEFIESNDPQTVVLRHAMTGEGESITVTPIGAGGEEIDEDTEYTLSRSDMDRCIDGDVTSVCVFTLSEDERDYINQHSELFLSLESDEPVQAEILCQSVVGGGLETSATDVCGLNNDSANEIHNPVVTDFTVVKQDGTFSQEGSPITTQEEALPDLNVGIEVMNAGTDPLQPEEPIHVYQNSELESLDEESISKSAGTDYNSDLDEETVIYNLSKRYPANALTLSMDMETNDGIVEIQVEDDEGDTMYQTFENVSGREDLALTELGQYTGDLTVTVNAITDSEGTAPTVNSMTVTAEDKEDLAETTINIGDMSGGSGILEPGETRQHVFDTTTFDLSTIVNPAVTLTAEVGDDQRDLVIKVTDGSSSGPSIVADAGGPYTATLEVGGWEREQVSYETMTATEKPGPEWTQVSTVDNPSDETTWTTVHRDVPKTNLSEDEAVQYYTSEEYIHQVKQQMPENLADDLTVKAIRFDSYQGEEIYFGTQSDLTSDSSLTYEEGGWSESQFGGETLSGYDTVQAGMVRDRRTGELSLDTDRSDAIYFFGAEDHIKTVSTIETREQESPPNNGSDAPLCEDVESTIGEYYPCWERGEYVGTERNTEDFASDTQEQECDEYYDPGPDWYVDSFSFNGGDCTITWAKVTVTESIEQYEWRLLDRSSEATLHVPQYENYAEHSRPMYNVEIVWSKDRSSSDTVHLWEGPRYTVTPDESVSSSTVNLDGSQSNAKSTVPIENYQWYIDGDPVDGSLNSASVGFSSPGRHEVKLTVQGNGLSDTDTTHIDVNLGCSEFSVCGGEVHPNLRITRRTEKVDVKYGEAAIEATLSDAVNKDYYTYRLSVTPAEADTITVHENEPCAEGYEGTTRTVEEDDNVEYAQPGDDVKLCEKQNSGPDSGPDVFVHPDDIDEVSVQSFTLESQTEKIFWEGGGIPDGGLTQVTHIDPSEMADEPRNETDFTVRLYVKDSRLPNASFNQIDITTDIIEFCKAGVPGQECQDMDSDLDAVYDGDPRLMSDYSDDEFTDEEVNDACPYDPQYDEFPCREINLDKGEQELVYGEGGWEINDDDTDSQYIGDQPHYVGEDNQVYSSETIELFYDSDDSRYLAHWPLDQMDTDSATAEEIWRANEVKNGYHGEGFVGHQERPEDGVAEHYVKIYRPPLEQGGDRTLVTTITEYDPTKWDEGAGRFSSSPVRGGDEVSFHIPSSQITGESVGVHVEPLDRLNGSQVNQMESLYGSDYANEYTYEIKSRSATVSPGNFSPVGNAYKFGGADGFYFGLANYKAWPGVSENPDDINLQTHNLHSELSNELENNFGYRIQFWYDNNNYTTSVNGEKAIYRSTDNDSNQDQDQLVATTQNFAPLPNDITHGELVFGSVEYGTEEWREFHNEHADQRSMQMGGSSNGDIIKYLLYVDDENPSNTYVIQIWNDDKNDLWEYDNPEGVSSVDDYYIRGYDPLEKGTREIIIQHNHKQEFRIAELSYVTSARLFKSDERADVIDTNLNGEVNGNLRGSATVPYLTLQTKGGNMDAIRRKQAAGPRFGTIDIYGASSVQYIENGKVKGSVFAGADSLDEAADAPDPNYSSDLQLFLGGGYRPVDVGLLREVDLRKFGNNFEGTVSNVQIVTDPEITDREGESKAEYVEEASLHTLTQGVPEEDIERISEEEETDEEDVTLTHDNMRIDAGIDWGPNPYPTIVTIKAIPLATLDDENTSDEYFIVHHRYSTILEESVVIGPGDSYRQWEGANTLDEDKYYTEFKIKVTVDTMTEVDGWTSPKIEKIFLRNFVSGSDAPSTEPIPADGNVVATGSQDRVSAPEEEEDVEGGGLNLSAYIHHEFTDSRTVPVKFIVRDNNRTLAEGDISTDDTDTFSTSMTWSELRDEGVNPREDEYIVEFVIKEHPNEWWPEKRLEIGRFIMCGDGNPDC